jgi:DNA (cytosine-5)-methyltransferase 1
VDNTETITVLSLCTGYGGLELGLAGALQNPMRVIAVEIEAYALALLAAKAQEGKLAVEAMWPDLRTFPAERFRGCFDFILAGYPCQPFSVAGKRQGTDDPRHLWPDIARIVEAVEPVWCFFENVPGHLSLGLPDVYCSLRNMGYKVEAGLFTAAEVGAPHRRQRLFILAYNEASGFSRGNLSIRQSQQQKQAAINTMRTGKMADAGGTKHKRRQGQQGNDDEKLTTIAGSCDKWPARPGQPQYEWEEPRVVGNAEYPRQGRSRRSAQRLGDRSEMCAEKAQSGVGRAVDGTARRVDRLRLLGNGVVPQQVEKAFRELIELFE